VNTQSFIRPARCTEQSVNAELEAQGFNLYIGYGPASGTTNPGGWGFCIHANDYEGACHTLGRGFETARKVAGYIATHIDELSSSADRIGERNI